MKIRLLLCSGSLEGGGSERQLWQLARGIDRSRFKPQIFLLHRTGLYLDKLPDDIKVHHFETDQSSGIYVPGGIHRAQVRQLQQLLVKEQIDVVYDRTFHMTLVTAAACRRMAVPRVSVIVSPPSRDFVQSGERFAFFKRRLLARAYRDALSQTIAVSQHVAEDAAQFYALDSAKIVVLPSPVDVAAVQLQATQADSSSAGHFCVVGRLSHEKGQRVALEAFAEYRKQTGDDEANLVLVGDGPDLTQLQHLSSELGVANRVQFRGFMENPYPLMKAAKALIVPSLYEGLPNVVLEAMALSTPVIATRCSPSLERVLQGDASQGTSMGALVDVGDHARLAQEMVRLTTEKSQWGRRVQLAHDYVQTQHGLEPWLRRMESILAASAGSSTWNSATGRNGNSSGGEDVYE